MLSASLLAASVSALAHEDMPSSADDEWRWLEAIDEERSLDWVKQQNARTRDVLTAVPDFEQMHQQAVEVLTSGGRIPEVTQRGEWLYNYWRDEDHPRGIYRRTLLESFQSGDPEWQTVLDIDALSAADDIQWVFSGMQCLPPAYRHCLVDLSPGGGDATVVKEFDMQEMAFVEDGFQLPKAKSQVSWRDEDSVFVGTDFGDGSMTDSGYPREVRLWRRGESLDEASSLYSGAQASVSVAAYRLRSDGGDIDLVREGTSFWTAKYWQLDNGELRELALPATAGIVGNYRGRLVVRLQEAWQVGDDAFTAGSVVLVDAVSLAEAPAQAVSALLAPSDNTVIESVTVSAKGILVTVLEDVVAKLYRYSEGEGGEFARQSIAFPDNGSLSVGSVDGDTGAFFVTYESFLVPPTLYHVAGPDWQPTSLRQQPPSFDSEGLTVEQHFALSADGTRVPYFLVRQADMPFDGTTPTHIFSYGGFRSALTPSYSGSYEALYGVYGKLWLQRGGAFVLANIRGGSEYGPSWHQAALLKNRHKAFEDFEAVAGDLIERKVTSAEHLGIEGRSNGGLLVGATMTRRSDLYGAVICGVPLLDMLRYHKLLAGASWMGEYGNPDDADMRPYLAGYSPYHNLDAEADYPPILFYTSTRDDRVHPGHARKMAARMMAQGHEVYYYENLEGGHGGSSTPEQLAWRVALSYALLWKALGGA
jgi:prolyl oligopeptidase